MGWGALGFAWWVLHFVGQNPPPRTLQKGPGEGLLVEQMWRALPAHPPADLLVCPFSGCVPVLRPEGLALGSSQESAIPGACPRRPGPRILPSSAGAGLQRGSQVSGRPLERTQRLSTLPSGSPSEELVLLEATLRSAFLHTSCPAGGVAAAWGRMTARPRGCAPGVPCRWGLMRREAACVQQEPGQRCVSAGTGPMAVPLQAAGHGLRGRIPPCGHCGAAMMPSSPCLRTARLPLRFCPGDTRTHRTDAAAERPQEPVGLHGESRFAFLTGLERPDPARAQRVRRRRARAEEASPALLELTSPDRIGVCLSQLFEVGKF
ncbi:uncharacterized protein LOC116570993 [Mustela erminea]|uniref:uncharacterized protein LOC116570993 n=1 Tax=Mustela erminea TaxID=36723 RepID=UPI001386EDA3|nr:uncharacterized protein LOC116570993 [Mustela erminea]